MERTKSRLSVNRMFTLERRSRLWLCLGECVSGNVTVERRSRLWLSQLGR